MTGDARRLLVEKARMLLVDFATHDTEKWAEIDGLLEAALSTEAVPPNHCPACGEPHDGADCPYQYLGTQPAEAVPSAPAGLRARLLTHLEAYNRTSMAAWTAGARTLLREAAAALDGQGDAAALPDFPIIVENGALPHPTRIPWSVADRAYSVYSGKYDNDQSLERIAQRGGFYPSEMDDYLPGWREEVSEIVTLRAELTRLKAAGDAAPRVAASQGDYKTHQCSPETFRKP